MYVCIIIYVNCKVGVVYNSYDIEVVFFYIGTFTYKYRSHNILFKLKAKDKNGKTKGIYIRKTYFLCLFSSREHVIDQIR